MKAGWITMPLAFFATFAFMFVVGTSGAGPAADGDGDGIQDDMDNCSAEANAGQYDSNQDGYGNICDTDFNNDGVTGGPDFGILVANFGSSEAVDGEDFNADVDPTEDGVVGGPDFGLLVGDFGSGPGPSGRSCANTVPPDPCSEPGDGCKVQLCPLPAQP